MHCMPSKQYIDGTIRISNAPADEAQNSYNNNLLNGPAGEARMRTAKDNNDPSPAPRLVALLYLTIEGGRL